MPSTHTSDSTGADDSAMNSSRVKNTTFGSELFEKWRGLRRMEQSSLKLSDPAGQVALHLTGRMSILVPGELLPAAEYQWRSHLDTKVSKPVDDMSALDVWATFLDAILDAPTAELAHPLTTLTPTSQLLLLRLAFDELKGALPERETVQTAELPNMQHVRQVYYTVLHRLSKHGWIVPDSAADSGATLPRLVEQQEAVLAASFGGQGARWLPELRHLTRTYPFTRDLVTHVASVILRDVSIARQQRMAYYHQGFDLIRWIDDESQTPDEDYLSSAPISFPCIALTQLVQYQRVMILWGKTEEQMRSMFTSITGHSQGIAAAVAVSSMSSDKSCTEMVVNAVRLLFWTAAHAQHVVPFEPAVSAHKGHILEEARSAGDNDPSPMLSISALEPERVAQYVAQVNNALRKDSSDRQIQIGLINGRRKVIVCGHPESLHMLAAVLRAKEMPASQSKDQTRVPFSLRKREFSLHFLNVSTPFHMASLLESCVDSVLATLSSLGIRQQFRAQLLHTPVISNVDGSDLRTSLDLEKDLVTMLTSRVVNWPRCMRTVVKSAPVTHIIDFGPSGSGSAILSGRLLQGTGVAVIAADVQGGTGDLVFPQSLLFTEQKDGVTFGVDWGTKYSPSLVKRSCDDTVFVDTSFSRLLGKPPVMVAGMTPTTVSSGFCAAVTRAGYHVELAGGGLQNEAMMRAAVSDILANSPLGSRISLNLLFLDARKWAFQYPLIVQMCEEGYPIDGVTIAAGVPSVDSAVDIVGNLSQAGVRHVSFKPGSLAAIYQVLDIAQAVPHATIVIQWTGGRGGGHHSAEDFHEPLLESYADIRKCSNVVLVVGSGFGDAQESWPYLTGSWSVKFGFPAMPCDGILLGSRVMVAAETETSDAVKERLVQTPGVETEGEWERSYEGVAGGVITVTSELGEPIHKVATRGMLMWRRFDKQFFSLPKGKRGDVIATHKSAIISALNADYQKVYFGKKYATGEACDVHHMTYLEVLTRMVDLMYVEDSKKTQAAGTPVHRWIHPTFLERVYLMARRTEERLVSRQNHDKSPIKYRIPGRNMVEEDPRAFLVEVESKYPQVKTQLLAAEDVDFFVELCRRRGLKPVNFIPIIDEDLSIWVKKDSLWYSEDLDAVPDRDVERLCILQGPVSVRHSVKANEPVADILSSIHNGYIELLGGQAEKDVDMLCEPAIVRVKDSVIARKGRVIIHRIQEEKHLVVTAQISHLNLPTDKEWMEWLAGPTYSWWRALLTSPTIVYDAESSPNIISKLFQPAHSLQVRLTFDPDQGNQLVGVKVFTPSRPEQASVVVEYNQETSQISVSLSHRGSGKSKAADLTLTYMYRPDLYPTPIVRPKNHRQEVKEFYARLWFASLEDAPLTVTDAYETRFEKVVSVTKEMVDEFNEAVTGKASSVSRAVPLDFSIVPAWEPLIKGLFVQAVSADMLKLVHLTHGYKRLDQGKVILSIGDPVKSVARITGIENIASGKKVSVSVDLFAQRDGRDIPYINMTSSFLFRGHFTDHENSFRTVTDDRRVFLHSEQDVAVIKSKPWLQWNNDLQVPVSVSDQLIFHTSTVEHHSSSPSDISALEITGDVYRVKSDPTTVPPSTLPIEETGEHVGRILYTAVDVKGNVVLSFLERTGEPLHPATYFSHNGRVFPDEPHTVVSPGSNEAYANASGDLNPIHTNQFFAHIADLPATITHGMWSCSNALRVVEEYAAGNVAGRVVSFEASFADMVLPGTELQTQLKHVGMRAGRMLLDVSTVDAATNVTVLKGRAEVRCPSTAYVFTGQGSAEAGMGMELYASSAVARHVWDAADAYFLKEFGFSLLDIVRRNPKEVTVHFGGTRGSAIRSKYRSLEQQVKVKEGEGYTYQKKRLFPDISDDSACYTFKHPEGLLFATQFTQPALVLVEVAAFRDMLAHRVVPDNSSFAGHSLGEYAALAAVGNAMSIESLVGIVFLRGLTMQSAVVRDADGHSNYAMVAANPSRVHPKMSEEMLHTVVDKIASTMKELIQVVNYNVRNQQYVVAGELSALDVLGSVLTMGKTAADPQFEGLEEFVARACQQTASKSENGRIVLKRGAATIPLPGIDVPFHSRFLEGGVPAFREILEGSISAESFDLSLLVHRYIPNLTAVPFDVTKKYAQLILDRTNSPVMTKVITQWDELSRFAQARALIVELLAYQFASPVRWIETQHEFFDKMNIERLIEVGPAPTLYTMAKRTLDLGGYSPILKRELLWYGRDRGVIYFEEVGQSAAPARKAKAEPAPAPTPAPAAAAAAPAPVPAATVAAAPVTDASPSPLDFMLSLISIRLKTAIGDVSASKSVKALSNGKSALQNELIGDIQKEFSNTGVSLDDGAAENSLQDVAATFEGKYTSLGEVGSTITRKLVTDKMPGGMTLSSVKEYLARKFGLGDGHASGVLLFGATHGVAPSQRFSSPAEANAWLDSTTAAYASRVGVNLSAPSAAPAAAAVAVAAGPAAAGGPPAPIADAPVDPLLFIRALIASRLKKSISAVPESTSIKAVSGGKSALQNEILGDVVKEFGSGSEPDGASDLALSELAAAAGSSYSALGPVSSSMVNKLFSTKMAPGFTVSVARSYLSSTYGLGSGRADNVLLMSVPAAPASRHASESESQSWLSSVALEYASVAGINLSSGGGAGASSAGAGVAVASVSSEALNAVNARHEALIRKHLDAYYDFLGTDPHSMERARALEQELVAAVTKERDMFVQEHGEDYLAGIMPIFDPKKQRVYDSYWNWTRQDVCDLYFDNTCGRASRWGNDIRERLYHIKNRTTSELVDNVEYYVKKAMDDGFPQTSEFATILHDTLGAVVDDSPVYRLLKVPTGPHVTVTEDGVIKYSERQRPGIKTMLDYCTEQETTLQLQVGSTAAASAAAVAAEQPQLSSTDMDKVWATLNGNSAMDPAVVEALQALVKTAQQEKDANCPPLLHLKTGDDSRRSYNPTATRTLFKALRDGADRGVCFEDKVALVTGCGRGSIGIEIVASLLRGGATVVVTTSRFSRKAADFYRDVFNNHGAKHSSLIVVPFNQASITDVNALVEHITHNLNLELDYVVPFAAISENGMDISDLGGRSELAHRIMLTNTIRLLGAIRTSKEERGVVTRPAHVILPLSPNHGIFGGDGLYAESKLALEGLLNKWKSENWSEYLGLCGAVIGWTRGTGLMDSNDVVACGIEKVGVRTYSTDEMAFNLMSLMHPEMVALSFKEPIVADLTGGLGTLDDLNVITKKLRTDLLEEASIKKAVTSSRLQDAEVEYGAVPDDSASFVVQRAHSQVDFPPLPDEQRRQKLKHLRGMADLDSVVVVTGFGEVGPWGSARLRWEMEAHGEFSLEGAIELAWMMGLIKYSNKEGSLGWRDARTNDPVRDIDVKRLYEPTLLERCGIRIVEGARFDNYDPQKKMFLHEVALSHQMDPIEVSTEEADYFKAQHGDAVDIFDNKGITYMQLRKGAVLYIPKALKFDRFVAGQIPTGWDPRTLGIPDDIIQQVDPVTLYTLASVAEAFIASGITDPYEFYSYVHVSEVGNCIGGGFGGMKSIRDTHRNRLFNRDVASDALQEQFINTVPAWINMLLLSSSGPIKTPVGACATAVESVEIGYDTIKSGRARICMVGGYDDFGEEGSYEFAQMKATSNAEAEIAAGREPNEMSRPATTTRGGFMESQGAGVQLLMTASLAIEMGMPIYGVIAMTNTATDKEGRSVPAPGQGILTTAREAARASKRPSPLLDIDYRRRQLQRELSSIDDWEREELAALTPATSSTDADSSPASSDAPADGEGARDQNTQGKGEQSSAVTDVEVAENIQDVHTMAQSLRKRALRTWGNDFFQGRQDIAPIRGALAVFGLTIDELDVASFHGTGTKLNDTNEAHVLQQQLEHLGRSKGNIIYTIFQKYLTGHPKGAAAAWMLNGMLQCLMTGIIPGNRNADNIDVKMRQYPNIMFQNRSLETYHIKAGILKSFGFGQVGAEVVVVHPDYLLAMVDDQAFTQYVQRRERRHQAAYRRLQGCLTGRVPFVNVKHEAPYSPEQQSAVYLDPTARASYHADSKKWHFTIKSKKTRKGGAQSHRQDSSSQNGSISASHSRRASEQFTPPLVSPRGGSGGGRANQGLRTAVASERAISSIEVTLREMAEQQRMPTDKGIGIDTELIADIDVSIANPSFLSRNFTKNEIAYCQGSEDPSSSFAGRWAAKEATIKAISNTDVNSKSNNLWKGAGAPLRDIEITPSESGAPQVTLTGYAQQVATALGVSQIKVTISHSGEYAVAQAVAR